VRCRLGLALGVCAGCAVVVHAVPAAEGPWGPHDVQRSYRVLRLRELPGDLATGRGMGNWNSGCSLVFVMVVARWLIAARGRGTEWTGQSGQK
jgi:hypothetical protein